VLSSHHDYTRCAIFFILQILQYTPQGGFLVLGQFFMVLMAMFFVTIFIIIVVTIVIRRSEYFCT
jgi:hypothetical protein